MFNKKKRKSTVALVINRFYCLGREQNNVLFLMHNIKDFEVMQIIREEENNDVTINFYAHKILLSKHIRNCQSVRNQKHLLREDFNLPFQQMIHLAFKK